MITDHCIVQQSNVNFILYSSYTLLWGVHVCMYIIFIFFGENEIFESGKYLFRIFCNERSRITRGYISLLLVVRRSRINNCKYTTTTINCFQRVNIMLNISSSSYDTSIGTVTGGIYIRWVHIFIWTIHPTSTFLGTGSPVEIYLSYWHCMKL